QLAKWNGIPWEWLIARAICKLIDLLGEKFQSQYFTVVQIDGEDQCLIMYLIVCLAECERKTNEVHIPSVSIDTQVWGSHRERWWNEDDTVISSMKKYLTFLDRFLSRFSAQQRLLANKLNCQRRIRLGRPLVIKEHDLVFHGSTFPLKNYIYFHSPIMANPAHRSGRSR